jgi:hypothetical protein
MQKKTFKNMFTPNFYENVRFFHHQTPNFQARCGRSPINTLKLTTENAEQSKIIDDMCVSSRALFINQPKIGQVHFQKNKMTTKPSVGARNDKKLICQFDS